MVIEYAGEAVGFECGDAAFAGDVASMLRPSFTFVPDSSLPLTGVIRVDFGDAAFPLETLKPWRRPPRFTMNEIDGPSFSVLEHESPRLRMLRHPDEDAEVLEIEVDRTSGTWTVCSYGDGDGAARAVARTVKYYLGCLMRKRGSVILHASGAERNGLAALFVGPTGSGKSTMMVRSCGLLGARFLADDIVLLWASADGAIRCSGWPKRVAVPFSALAGLAAPRQGCTARSDGLAARFGGEPEHRPPELRERLLLDAEEFLSCFGVEAAGPTDVPVLVRPRFSEARDGGWKLVEGVAIHDAAIHPRHEWSFTDYLSIVPEPLGARLTAERGGSFRALPGYELQYRELLRQDCEAIWTRLSASLSHPVEV